MICLTCLEPLESDAPGNCAFCDVEHAAREPVIGVNHISQVLSALDRFREGSLDPEGFEEIWRAFSELLTDFQEKWDLDEGTLEARVSGSIGDQLGENLRELDRALDCGFRALDFVEFYFDSGEDVLNLVGEEIEAFFQGVCAQSAVLLDKLERWDSTSAEPGQILSLPAV